MTTKTRLLPQRAPKLTPKQGRCILYVPSCMCLVCWCMKYSFVAWKVLTNWSGDFSYGDVTFRRDTLLQKNDQVLIDRTCILCSKTKNNLVFSFNNNIHRLHFEQVQFCFYIFSEMMIIRTFLSPKDESKRQNICCGFETMREKVQVFRPSISTWQVSLCQEKRPSRAVSAQSWLQSCPQQNGRYNGLNRTHNIDISRNQMVFLVVYNWIVGGTNRTSSVSQFLEQNSYCYSGRAYDGKGWATLRVCRCHLHGFWTKGNTSPRLVLKSMTISCHADW